MTPDPPPIDSPGLLVPRFSLRSVFVWITGLCALLAVLVSVPLGPAVVIAGVGALVVAHVVGNALGTRLRSLGRGARERPSVGGQFLTLPSSPAGPIPPSPPLQLTRLREKQRLSRTVPLVAGSSALVGALAGGLILAWYNYPRGTVAGLVVGGLSCGFLGGFVGFLAGSFLEIFGPAWTEAASLAPDPPRRKRRPRPAPNPTFNEESCPVPQPGRRAWWFARR